MHRDSRPCMLMSRYMIRLGEAEGSTIVLTADPRLVGVLISAVSTRRLCDAARAAQGRGLREMTGQRPTARVD